MPEDSDQRTGTTGIKATYHWGSTSFIGVWLPTFQPDIIPIQTPPDPFVLLPRQLPNEPVSQFALKVDQTGGKVDWSVSFFDGFDLYPDLEITGLSLTKVFVAPTYHTGAGHRASMRPLSWARTGFAQRQPTRSRSTRTNNQVKSPFFLMVLGADRTFLGSLNINAQFMLRAISDYTNPITVPNPINRAVFTEQATINNQLDQVQESIAFRVNKKWLNETLETEVASIVNLARLDYAVRPKVKYAITDRLRSHGGG